MRTTLFKITGITELTIDLLVGCNFSDFKKEYAIAIMLALGDHRDFKFHARPPHNTINYWEIVTAENYREISLPARNYCRFDKESKN